MSFNFLNNKKWCAASNRSSGFTLLEVMISLFILVLIGTTTSKAVIDAAKLKEVLKDETEFSSEFRTSVGFIERDLAQVFNPRWFLAPDFQRLDPYAPPIPPPVASGTGQPAAPVIPRLSADDVNRLTRGNGFQTYEFWGPIIDSTGIRSSRFQGKEQMMSFVSASHSRIYKAKKESIYSKVKYELIKQPPNPNLNREENQKRSGLYALIKIENTRAFETDDPREAKYINTYVVLNNIKKFSLRYFRKDEKDPIKTWDSEATDTKEQFPTAVEMELTVMGPKDREFDAKVTFNLETPNEIIPRTY
jgi:prepilin-type N-terminal cleavage/methylation domain-containing protein